MSAVFVLPIGNVRFSIHGHDPSAPGDRPAVPGCPFVVQQDGAGAHRLVRRACHL
ncbi:MAG: hypothetical protein ACFE0J_21400 [Elainellaceae cyanobacterium]